jgi:hypothetical protein
MRPTPEAVQKAMATVTGDDGPHWGDKTWLLVAFVSAAKILASELRARDAETCDQCRWDKHCGIQRSAAIVNPEAFGCREWAPREGA